MLAACKAGTGCAVDIHHCLARFGLQVLEADDRCPKASI